MPTTSFRTKCFSSETDRAFCKWISAKFYLRSTLISNWFPVFASCCPTGAVITIYSASPITAAVFPRVCATEHHRQYCEEFISCSKYNCFHVNLSSWWIDSIRWLFDIFTTLFHRKREPEKGEKKRPPLVAYHLYCTWHRQIINMHPDIGHCVYAPACAAGAPPLPAATVSHAVLGFARRVQNVSDFPSNCTRKSLKKLLIACHDTSDSIRFI
jgi:hypothetical protein